MKKIRVLAIFLVMIFLTTMISPNFVYAREKLKGNSTIEEGNIVENDLITAENLLLDKYKKIINDLNTEENKSKFIITDQEVDVILRDIDTYEKNINTTYVNGRYNKSIILFELRQKIVNNCNLYGNARLTSEE